MRQFALVNLFFVGFSALVGGMLLISLYVVRALHLADELERWAMVLAGVVARVVAGLLAKQVHSLIERRVSK